MRLKYQYDFTGNDNYPLPYVLVYEGSLEELDEVVNHCRNLPLPEYGMGVQFLLGESGYSFIGKSTPRARASQSFHFLHKRDVMLVKLSFPTVE